MTFEKPWVLLFLVVPILLGVWVIQRRVWGLALPFDGQDHIARRFLGGMLRFWELVPLMLWAVIIMILAGPQRPRVPKEERQLTNIQICMDVSASMIQENRYEMARKAIEGFIDSRQGDALGFTVFGTQQVRWTPLTKDTATIRRALRFADPRNQPPFMGGTQIGAALRFCRDHMTAEATEGDRVLLLVSDGMSADINGGNAGEFADEMREAGITLYHIHVGTGAVPAEVMEIAKSSGGDAFVATDESGLKRVFRHIDRMKPAKFRAAAAVPMHDDQPFALVTLGLLALYGIGTFGMRFTPW